MIFDADPSIAVAEVRVTYRQAAAPEPISTDNNFNAIRLIAATLVMVDHGHKFQGRDEPFFQLTGFPLGISCVLAFFAVSGFLVTQSLDRRSILDFVMARALRIFPGLAVCCTLTALGLAALSSLPLGDYLTDPRTLRFIFGDSTLTSMQYNLPGVFTGNRDPYANGSLWTLPYEIFCYGAFGLALAGTRRAGRMRRLVLVLIGAACAAVFISYPFLPENFVPNPVLCGAQLGAAYLVGATAASIDQRFDRMHVAAALALMVITRNTGLEPLGHSVGIGVGALWLARGTNPILRRLSALPDYSYGIYIYAFPVQQVISHFAPDLPPIPAISAAFVVTVGLAATSWTFVEKPALALKRRHFWVFRPLAAAS